MAEAIGIITGTFVFAVIIYFFLVFLTRFGDARKSKSAEDTKKIRQDLIAELPKELKPLTYLMTNLFEHLYGRLQQEIDGQRLREHFSFAMGFALAMVGIGLILLSIHLGGGLTNAQGTLDALLKVVYAGAPRFTISILIECLAIFFFRLYKETLESIKQFQNEITTLELKYMALLHAYACNSNLPKVLSIIAQSERNFSPKIRQGKGAVIDIRLLEKALDLISNRDKQKTTP